MVASDVTLRDHGVDSPPPALLYGEPTLEARAGQYAELYLRQVEPTAVLGRVKPAALRTS